jgi:hypothetical protein
MEVGYYEENKVEQPSIMIHKCTDILTDLYIIFIQQTVSTR